MKTFYKKEEVKKFLEKKYDIPKNIKQIRIDVGLAGEAPNSAKWICETDDRYVFGIEPLEHHWNMLTNFKKSNTTRPYPNNFPILQLEKKTIEFCGSPVQNIENRFTGLQCAIDNVEDPIEQDFYEMDRHMGASGSSSLLSPSEHHPHKLNDCVKVLTINLEMLLDKVPWDRFPYIEHIKTDCEGKDFDVVKSIGKYLKNIVFITSEMTSNTHHVNGANSQEDFLHFMLNNGFGVLDAANGNISFVNKRFIDVAIENKLDNSILGF